MLAEAHNARTSGDTTAGRGLVALIVLLFFTWGFITVLNDPLIAKLKGLFSLTYAEAMLTQFAFFLGYFIFSVPAGAVLARLGYIRSIVLGLVIMAVGCLMFAPAAMLGTYPGFLVALFLVACGMTMLQVAANPYIAVLGSKAGASSRLTLAQAFNSLGTFIGPFVGALFLLQNGIGAPTGGAASAARHAEAQIVQRPFLVIAALLLLLALVFWSRRNAPGPRTEPSALNPFRAALFARRRLMFGVLSIFLYVGAEVSIGSGLINYLLQPQVLGSHAGGGALGGFLHMVAGGTTLNGAQIAGALVSVYWGCAMIGRFIGSYTLVRFSAGKVLCVHALCAMVLALVSAGTGGTIAAVAVLAVGLANSVMFPTIFALAVEDLGEETPNGSALLCTAIVGGAIVPVIYGAVADGFGLSAALVVPAICYLLIAGFGGLVVRGLGNQA
jgi:MFS transporter, FHS family, L-fucose permease